MIQCLVPTTPIKGDSYQSPNGGYSIVFTSIKRPLATHFPEGGRIKGIELRFK